MLQFTVKTTLQFTPFPYIQTVIGVLSTYTATELINSEY